MVRAIVLDGGGDVAVDDRGNDDARRGALGGRLRRARRRPGPATRWPRRSSFAGGYFVVWLGYSVLAALLQLAAGMLGVLSHQGASNLVAGMVLIGAGAFQFAPVKQACLAHCRNPLSYLLSRWVDGPIGGFRLGLTHGAYCVGCCWLLMLTGFAVGLMNLAWMAVLTVVVSLEQGTRGGVRLGRLFGAALIAWGIGLCWPA